MPCAPPTHRINDTRPTAIIASTIKGYGLPTEGRPQNHSSLPTVSRYEQLASELGMDAQRPWSRFEPYSAAEVTFRSAADGWPDKSDYCWGRPPLRPISAVHFPPLYGPRRRHAEAHCSTLSRQSPGMAKFIVTVSPDVSSSTNLASRLNMVGVWSAKGRHDRVCLRR